MSVGHYSCGQHLAHLWAKALPGEPAIPFYSFWSEGRSSSNLSSASSCKISNREGSGYDVSSSPSDSADCCVYSVDGHGATSSGFLDSIKTFSFKSQYFAYLFIRNLGDIDMLQILVHEPLAKVIGNRDWHYFFETERSEFCGKGEESFRL